MASCKETTISYLKNKRKILFLTTSNRYSKHADQPKSTALAYSIANKLGNEKVTVIEVPLLNIYPCEGNVSAMGGNNCGVKDAKLLDKYKNPTGYIRCWAAYNNPDDEIYKVANAIFESDAVVFFASVRWGQSNGYFQKLIERLTWIENRCSTLGEENLLSGKDAGFICVGQNWNGKNVVSTEKEVLKFFGFNTPSELFWNWQYTSDPYDESEFSYRKAVAAFEISFGVRMEKFISLIKKLRASFVK